MSYYSPSFSNIDRPMASLPATRVKSKGQAIPPSVAPSSPHEFPSIHSYTLVHFCTYIKRAIGSMLFMIGAVLIPTLMVL